MTVVRSVLFVAVAALSCSAAEPSSGSRRDSWILVVGDKTHMSGSTDDLERVHKLAGDGPALWMRRQGKEWLVRDAGTIARAQALMAPIEQLGHAQGELGRKQSELGRKQGELGRKQGELGRQMGELSGDTERNAAKMDALGRQMNALGKEMDALGEKMSALGTQMDALGKQMDEASQEVGRKLGALVDEARAANLAQPVR